MTLYAFADKKATLGISARSAVLYLSEIDSFVYSYIGGWHWLRDGEQNDGNPKGTYENCLYGYCPFREFKLYAPGSNMEVNTSNCIGILKDVLDYMTRE